MFRTTFRLFAILSLLFSVSAADEMMSLQFLAMPKQVRPEPLELLIGENETIDIHTPSNELSRPYEVPALDSIIVGQTSVNDQGESVFNVLGRARSIGSSKQIILLMRKGEEAKDGFTVLPVSGELGDFGGGSYLLVNASGVNVAGKMGDKSFELAPGSRELLQPAATHEGGGCQVTFAYMRGQEWKVFRDTRWSVNPSYRSLVFFYQNPSTEKLAVAPVVDLLPPAPR